MYRMETEMETECELRKLNERVNDSVNNGDTSAQTDDAVDVCQVLTVLDTQEDVYKTEVCSDQISKQSLVRTLIAVGISFMLTFSAFDAFSNLQSTLHTVDGLGTTGLALIYVFMIVTNLFLTTFSMTRFHAKWIIVFSMVTYIVYIITGFYPSWYTVIPASAVIGIGASHLWIAVVIYITDIAKRYAVLTKTKEHDRVNLFLGIFYGFMYTSQVWGNLISSLVFQRSSSNDTSHIQCGYEFCPSTEGNNTVITRPTNVQVYRFIGICIGLAATGVAVLAIFAANVRTGTQHRRTVLETLKLVTKHMLSSRSQQLLILPSMLGGLWGGFVVGDFTIAYISCPYGIEHVGFVMIAFGLGQSLCSVIFGKLSQYTGHLIIYIVGSVVEIGALSTLLLWTPNKQGYYVVFILAAVFGIGVAVNYPVTLSHYNQYFNKNLETAHSSFRLLSSIGWAIALGYSSALCTNKKVYILLFVVFSSVICIIILSWKGKQVNKTYL